MTAKGIILLKGITEDEVDNLIFDEAPAPMVEKEEGYYYVTNPATNEKKLIRVDPEKVSKVTFKEPAEAKSKAPKLEKPPKQEATVKTGVEVTSDPSQLVIYYNTRPTKWKTPETLKLTPGPHVIGVDGKTTGDGIVTVEEGKITPVHIVV